MKQGITPLVTAIAVALLLLIGVGAYFVTNRTPSEQQPVNSEQPPPPASNQPPMNNQQPPPPPSAATRPPAATTACKVTGCSGQVCSDQDIVTTCEYKAEYACYKNAICKRQANGQCGWTDTAQLRACLNASVNSEQRTVNNPSPPPPPAAVIPPPPSTSSGQAPPSAQTSNFSLEADDYGFYPSNTITVPKGSQVKLTFTVRTTNVYYGGLDFRSSKFNTQSVKPGDSTTVEFDTTESFDFTSYWPISSVKKATGHVDVQ